jgi:hypothetical protein
MALAGAMRDSQLISEGSITSIKLLEMDNSDVFAGVASAGLPDTAADFFSRQSIGSFTITGGTSGAPSFSNSNIAAWSLGTVYLGYPDYSANGLASGTYATFSWCDSTDELHTWKKSDPTAFLPGSGVLHVFG